MERNIKLKNKRKNKDNNEIKRIIVNFIIK